MMPTVTRFAFVMPCYDLRSVDEFIPCDPVDCVLFKVWFWDDDGQVWACGYETEDVDAAQREAARHHRVTSKRLGLTP